MSKPDTSAETQGRLVHEHDGVRSTLGMRPYEHGDTAATLRALLAERDAAIAARDEAIRRMGEASRQAGSWQGIAEGKDIVIRQLEAERDALQVRLRGASLDMLAANDAPLLDAEAAFAAGAAAMRRALDAAAEWFEEYAEGHQAKGAIDKASRNLERANACRRAALAQEPRHD
jgi:hypothetical protein